LQVGVDFLPEGETFQRGPRHADRCIAVMPCGHMFGAIALAYNAAIADMRCPMCRQGLGKRMRPSCLPEHLRGPFGERVSRNLREEIAEYENANDSAIHALLQADSEDGDDAMVAAAGIIVGGGDGGDWMGVLMLQQVRLSLIRPLGLHWYH
jgi:hypothetical protein